MNQRQARAIALDMASSVITSALGAAWEVESSIAFRLGIAPEAVSEQDAARVVAALYYIAQRLDIRGVALRDGEK